MQEPVVQWAGVGFDWEPLLWFVGMWVGLVGGGLFLIKKFKDRPSSNATGDMDRMLGEIREKREAKRRARQLAKANPEAPIEDLEAGRESFSMTGETPRPAVTSVKTKEVVVTERTREEMFEMLSGVKSLTQEMSRPNFDDIDLTDSEIAQLKDNEIVKSLAETLLSDVQTEEVKGQKFSKMSLDASLFFDETDVGFFEKEFGADLGSKGGKK